METIETVVNFRVLIPAGDFKYSSKWLEFFIVNDYLS